MDSLTGRQKFYRSSTSGLPFKCFEQGLIARITSIVLNAATNSHANTCSSTVTCIASDAFVLHAIARRQCYPEQSARKRETPKP